MLISTVAIGAWSPQIGDPSFWGWFTVYSYYATAIACLCATFYSNKVQKKLDISFLAFFCIIGVLGICKQFNLPSAITEICRMQAHAEGWIQQRRVVQALVMVSIGACGIVAFMFLAKNIKLQFFHKHMLGKVAIGYLLVFVFFRSVSLHQWENMLSSTVFGLRVNWIGELAGIHAVFLSVVLYFSLPPKGRRRQ
jgi:hypothetical protein